MNNPIKKKKSNVATNSINGGQKPSPLITIQSLFPKNGEEKISFLRASEATIFEKLPLIRSLFDLKFKKAFKDNKDQIFYDPKHANTKKPPIQTVPERIFYIYDLVQSKLTQHREGHDKISKWNLKTLWTLMDCLVRFLDGQALHLDSRIGRSKKFWQKELAGVELLAIYLGNADMKDKAVRSALVLYMRQVPATKPTHFKNIVEKGQETTQKPNAHHMVKAKKPNSIDLKAEDSIPVPQKLKREAQSNFNTQKLNKKAKFTHNPQEVKKETQSAPTRENIPPAPKDAYIQLNESYPGFLCVKIDTALKGSRLIGRLLQDLYSGAFATGELSKLVGKNRDGKPTLLWDEVLKHLSKPGSKGEVMLSWGEDDRWAPLVMFVERCQVDRALWQDWDEEDLEVARCFDSFVNATVCASEVQKR